MLKKRLIGVVTVKDGWAVQSIGYKKYLPLGKPECLVENLDRWGADEILVQVIDRSINSLGPDFDILQRLSHLGLETPLIYAGGISTVEDAGRAIQCGADRIVVDALFQDDLRAVKKISERLGSQAVIASMPLSLNADLIEWWDYRTKTSTPIADEVLTFLKCGIISEIFIIDWQHEGKQLSFDRGLVENFPLQDIPIIAFGGISDSNQIAGLLQFKHLTAVAVGNFLSYREHAIQKIKETVMTTSLRLPVYESKCLLTTND